MMGSSPCWLSLFGTLHVQVGKVPEEAFYFKPLPVEENKDAILAKLGDGEDVWEEYAANFKKKDPTIRPSQMERMLKQSPNREALRQLGLISDNEDSD